MPDTIHQSVTIKAAPHEVYEVLMDSEKHAAFTGSKAKISREVGGSITAYAGYITGKNIELISDRKIVQDWRAVDWPEGYYSQVTFELNPVSEGTRIDFTHINLPDKTEEEFTQGWVENYWKPMKEYFEKQRGKM